MITASWLRTSMYHFAGDDPATRPPPFATSPGDVAVFADEGGLVIDTPSMFRLAKPLQRGEVEVKALRTELRPACGAGLPTCPASAPVRQRTLTANCRLMSVSGWTSQRVTIGYSSR